MKNERSVPSKREIVPYFQPIVSLQSMRIIGYESLGRHLSNGKAYSLGTFFKNPFIPEETHMEFDRHLREMAIEKLSNFDADTLLFINLKPSWIYRAWKEKGMLHTLILLDKYGIDPKRIVIEITEEEFNGNLYDLTEILEEYRKKGCTIAIDDVGMGFSNFDRIAVLQPKILKVDLDILKKSHSHKGYRAVMQSFSILASQLGASLLVEGVETKEDLRIALQAGARYVQGFLFSSAVPGLMSPFKFVELLEENLGRFVEEEFSKYANVMSIENKMNKILSLNQCVKTAEEADYLIEISKNVFQGNCIRIYICRGEGKQLSSNFIKDTSGKWFKDQSFQGCNWIWRPYFISNIVMMNAQGKGILSTEYADLETSEMVQTYSFPLGNNCYIFLDLLYKN